MAVRTHALILALSLAPLFSCSKSSVEAPQPPVEHRKQSDLASKQAQELELKFAPLLAQYISHQASVKAPAFEPASNLKSSGLLAAHQSALLELYQTREGRPVWIDTQRATLNPQATELLSALRNIDTEHGVHPGDVNLYALESALETMPAQNTEDLFTLAWRPSHRKALTTWFESNQPTQDSNKLLGTLFSSGGPLESFSKDVSLLVNARVKGQAATHKVEVMLSDALIRYAKIMRLENDHWYPKDPARTEQTENEVMKRRITHALMPLFKRDRPLRPLLARLQPPFEQYERLIQAHQKYRTIVSQGGWKSLPDRAATLRPGHKHALVPELKARLRQEGFWSGDDTNHYSDSLAKAVTMYQHTHQVWERGYMTKETVRSMNVPVARRLLRIKQSLARWRQSPLAGQREYVYVNVPDFHAEVWADGSRKMRFRVVTGSSKQVWNPRKKTHERPLATKLFSDKIEYMVFNPYWNVPKDIVQKEILPKLDENPSYLEENGYEWVDTSSHDRILRQLPGRGNALGDVKFIFPNEHNIYMHDTPDKGFFNYPIRAFSHGCVRVHEPMKFAQYLLERDGNWDPEKLKGWLRQDKELWFRLTDPLPVHIDYVVARVDDDGQVHFLADVYRYDDKGMTKIAAQDAANASIEKVRSLLPKPKKPAPVKLAQN